VFKKSFRSTSLIVLLVLSLVVLTACGSDSSDSKDSEDEETKTLTPTSIQLSWVNTIEFAGLYAADAQGYYADNGLEVTIHGGGFDENGQYIDALGLVLSGEGDFGVGDAASLLRARAEDKPLVAIASIYQRSPVSIIALGSSEITRLQDLVGQRVMVEEGSNLTMTYEAMLESQNIDRSQIVEVPNENFVVDPLVNGEVDAYLGFLTNEAMQVEARTEDTVHNIMAGDYGVDIYVNLIFTSEDTINNRPELVESFLDATLAGMRWAVENPNDAAQIVLDRFGDDLPETIRAFQPDAMQASVPLLEPAGSRIGDMDPEVWGFTQNFMVDHGVLSEAVDLEQVFTLSFLDKVYE
jgi:ABC-type nitrate/sulfonate/bicarbonate transport system substrate-binding protein